jgi:hypothetical protein
MGLSTSFVVQACHYAQFTVYETGGDVRVDILDEDDVERVLVAIRDTEEAAQAAAEEWRSSCEPDDESTDGPQNMPLASINIFEVSKAGPPAEGRFVKDVEV